MFYTLSMRSCFVCGIQALYPTKISLEPLCHCKSLHKMYISVIFNFLALRSVFCLSSNLFNLNMFVRERLSLTIVFFSSDTSLQSGISNFIKEKCSPGKMFPVIVLK